MTSAREIRLECAAFLDSPQAGGLIGRREDQRKVVERFLACCYDEIGKAPHLLEGEDLEAILVERLPAHFGRRDPLGEGVEEILAAYLAFLGENRVVLHAFEQGRALLEHAPTFRLRLASGELAGRAPGTKKAPFIHRAQKTGRNDPCPCGSGKKFKQCCQQMGSG